MSPADHILLEQWQKRRDANAFQEIIARHGAMVYAVCRRILRNSADAEEVAQECFLALAQAESGSVRVLGGWLHRFATHRSLDRVRADSRRRPNSRNATQARAHRRDRTLGRHAAQGCGCYAPKTLYAALAKLAKSGSRRVPTGAAAAGASTAFPFAAKLAIAITGVVTIGAFGFVYSGLPELSDSSAPSCDHRSECRFASHFGTLAYIVAGGGRTGIGRHGWPCPNNGAGFRDRRLPRHGRTRARYARPHGRGR